MEDRRGRGHVVKTIVEKVNVRNPESGLIRRAAKIIKSGGIVIYPTETCYGLAADATNAAAVRKVYAVKKRPKNKPIPIIVSSLDMMKKYGRVTKLVRALAREFMPGPLTIVIDKKTLPDILNPNEIAFRISSHTIARVLVRSVGRPITATSANISGHPPIYKSKRVIEVFNGEVDMILDCGNLKKTKPSTYVDARNCRVLRKGAVQERKIINFIERATKR
jgi:L-threonylcarbamoyladenylate synthase